MAGTKAIIDGLLNELWPIHERHLEHPRPAIAVYRTGLQHGFVAALDAFHGTPCAEIRWGQERDELLRRVANLESEVEKLMLEKLSNNKERES